MRLQEGDTVCNEAVKELSLYNVVLGFSIAALVAISSNIWRTRKRLVERSLMRNLRLSSLLLFQTWLCKRSIDCGCLLVSLATAMQPIGHPFIFKYCYVADMSPTHLGCGYKDVTMPDVTTHIFSRYRRSLEIASSHVTKRDISCDSANPSHRGYSGLGLLITLLIPSTRHL